MHFNYLVHGQADKSIRLNLWRRRRRIRERQRRLQLVRARIEEQRVAGRRVEREGALRLANVVPPDGLLAELEDEFGAVVDFERLTLRLN